MPIFRHPRTYIPLAFLGFLISVSIALNTNSYHPDERMHIDAFCYFEWQWWSPPVNSSEVIYSPDGWSRVYTGEVVYQAYGRLSRLISPLRRPPNFSNNRSYLGRRIYLPLISSGNLGSQSQCQGPTYRLFNSGLLLVTLLVLFRAGAKKSLATVVGLTLLCLPQVIYLYSYANSDAWGLSFSLFVFLFALVQERPFASWPRILGLSFLTGMVLLSKQSFYVSLLFSYALIAWNVFKHRDSISPKRFVPRVFILIILILCVIAPVKIANPWLKGYSSANFEAMREQRAWEAFRPSNPTQNGYRLAAKGVSFLQMIETYGASWSRASSESLYGRFGYMDVRLPQWVYRLIAAVFLLRSLSTYGIFIYQRRIAPGSLKLMLLLAPLAIGMSVLGSLYNSWTYDFQPQGRYLFSALAPLAVLMGGTIDMEPP